MIRWILIVGLISFGAQACQTSALHINATYERLYGVELGDRVLFEQNVAGSVADVQYGADEAYTLKLDINKGFLNAVTEYSQFYIVDDPNRDGRKAVEIRLAQPGGKVLADGTTVKGVSPSTALSELLRRDIEAGFAFIQSQIERFSRDVQKIPDSDAYQTLRESMEALADEILQAEKAARERLKDEWVPKLERQLEVLREKLRQLGRENELKPLDKRMERIRKI